MTTVVAAPPPPPAGSPLDAQFVAKSFAYQYYNVLLHSPAHAYKFYEDSSVVSWPGSDRKSVVTVTTTEKIKELIMSQDYKDCQAVVDTVDGQDSQSRGVTVLVTGTLRRKETSRSFSQIFFLANKGDHCYYVLNDILRFVDNDPPAAAVALVPTDGEKLVSASKEDDAAVVPAAVVVGEKAVGVESLIPRRRSKLDGFLVHLIYRWSWKFFGFF